MVPPTRRLWVRFIAPCVVAAALVLSAPFIGQIRSALRRAFPGQFVTIVGAVVAAAVAAAIIVAIVRIRNRRASRYAAIGVALAIGVAYAFATRTGRPDVDVVERVHFVEYGIVTYLFYRAWRGVDDLSRFVLPLLAGVIVGTCEEWFQWFVPVRVGEVKDVFLNAVAIGCGLLVSYAIDPPSRITRGMPRKSLARIAVLSAAVLLVFGIFFHVVHLGYDVTDQAIGTFRSRYDESRLLQLSADRALGWREDPPLKLVRMSREDQYMTEGVVHVQRRNEAWAAGDVAAAWAENLILEKYFAPVLDTPSYVSPSGHRWPAAQRSDAHARVAAARRQSYVSEAYPYRLYVWPRLAYWVVVLTVGALLCGVALRYTRSDAAAALT